MEKPSSSLTAGSRTKHNKRENEDRISGLPDAVLCHILSFLPTKFAVGTGILSRRWAFLWTSAPVLDFDDRLLVSGYRFDDNLICETHFFTFTNRVLIFHKMQSIRKFYLKLSGNYDSFHVNAWISSVIMRNVEEIDLCIKREDTVQTLPRSFFIGSDKLMVLKLQHNIVLNVPHYVSFPSLKVLHLDRLPSLSDDSIGRLILGSPVLEDLVIRRGFDDNEGILCVHSHSLKTFKIEADEDYSDEANKDYSELVVDAPKLEYLDIKNLVYKKWSFAQMPSLVKAIVNISSQFYQGQKFDDRVHIMVQILRQISNVKVLNLSEYTLLTLDKANHLAAFNNLPSFHNLIHLKVNLRIARPFSHSPNVIFHILEHTPNLELLILKIGYMWDSPASVPKCMLSTLKVVQFEDFVGSDEDHMEVVEYLLKNALVLEKLIIPLYREPESDILKKLLMFPRASSSCQIVFHDLLNISSFALQNNG